MAMCKECGEVIASREVVNGFCESCREEGKVLVVANTAEIQSQTSIENNAAESLAMNPFSFIQMSGSLNYLIYGFLVPTVLIVLAFSIGNSQVGVVFGVLAVAMSLASIVRRGMDAGITPLTVITSLLLSSWLISTILEKTLISFKILFMSSNPIVGMIILAIIQNIYLVYLLFAPQKEMAESKANKTVQRIILGLIIILVIGILASLAIPRLV